ncbi:MAG: 23S rRNA (adenine(2030)-N(6))-methyltransferase RlmJ [Alphaproteobacteria bacterium]|nr:23S rRNA (adenine(2030)-N(6))-methyltransferase RlmJ [Alphaproteobacteria bacterium]
MLSYRHAFHAGHAADVLKHAVYVFILRYMQQKDGGMLLLDTHAGAGEYDLAAPEAQKTGEFHDGVERLLAASAEPPALIADYLALLRGQADYTALRRYPGSPALAAALMRPQDRAVLCELHPTDHAHLARWARGRRRVSVRREDGLSALPTLLPPPERRALTVIDPSYEVKSDYGAVVDAVEAAWRRFPAGVFLLWYPVVDRARIDGMEVSFRAGPVRKLFRLELGIAPDAPGRGMTASGLFVVNPPFTLPDAAAAALPWLTEALGARGPRRADWVVPE